MTCIHRGKLISTCSIATHHQCNKQGKRCVPTNAQLEQILPLATVPFITCEYCPLFEEAPQLVSAICLAYDLQRRQNVLEEAIESFLRQTWPLKELVIVNDSPNLEIICDAPGVRIVTVPPCRTLGDKYNAGVEAAKGSLICSWDDDDISLPWRMSLSIELMGQTDYFNPKAHWFLADNADPLHEYWHIWAHNASMFRKLAWERVGKYASLEDNSQDCDMDVRLQTNCPFIHGGGAIEQTAYIYRWQASIEHGSVLRRKIDDNEPGRFVLSPHWDRDYTKLTLAARPEGTPVWLTNRDSMQVTQMVDRLLNCSGVGQITIVDCASTYPPLLEWYGKCPVNVIRADNLGHFAPWNFLDQSKPYIVSDGDFDISKLPLDFVEKLKSGLEKFPDAIKVGLSLKIDDLPPLAPKTEAIIEHESKFWTKPLDDEHFDAAIDTTLAMYRAGTGWGGYEPAVRLNEPYTARHVPWYLTSETMTDDWRYYFKNMDGTGLTWGPALAQSLNKQQPIATGPKLTIGMPHYRDATGVIMTVMSLLMHHAECRDDIEIIIVDNDPDELNEHSKAVRLFCGQNGTRYERFTDAQGTAAAKGHIFDLASAPTVMVIDCHVMIPAGVLRRLINYCVANTESKNLIQGPLIGDGGIENVMGTHFEPKWGSWMFGQWAVNEEAVRVGHPFQIDMQGCGLFVCNKKHWPGFHPLLNGFGPEEGHIHNRIRRNGGNAICLPWLRWWHRFFNPHRSLSPNDSYERRLRGYVVTWLDTGSPSLDSIVGHYSDQGMDRETINRVVLATRAEFLLQDERRKSQITTYPCIHRQAVTEIHENPPCQGGPEPIYGCQVHDKCSIGKYCTAQTVRACSGCGDRVSVVVEQQAAETSLVSR